MPEVCLVVPCFNEARRLNGDAFIQFLQTQPHCSMCFVDDGSSDDTSGVLDALQTRLIERVHVLKLPTNAGKAEAVRQGVRHVSRIGSSVGAGRFAYVGYWDADLSTPLSELTAMLGVLDRHPACLLAMGSRLKRLGSTVTRSPIRHGLGRIFATAASTILRMPVYDSQCGAKVFRAGIADLLFADPFISPWTFDVELLARLRNHLGRDEALGAIIEVPLGVWREVGGSKMSVAHMAAVPLGLLKIRRRYNTPP